MVLLAARLGLCIGDIRNLKLHDIDWTKKRPNVIASPASLRCIFSDQQPEPHIFVGHGQGRTSAGKEYGCRLAYVQKSKLK